MTMFEGRAPGNQSEPWPAGTWVILFIQTFSTMSFAVLYATLVLYMKQQLGLSSQQANTITGVYFAYNFALHLLSGFLAGRLFSYRALIVVGLIFQTLGCFILAMNSMSSLYWGLACMLVGTGSMVTCINMLVSQLYHAEDKRRESAFLINYSAMNIGFLLGFSLAGFFQLAQNFNTLFFLTAISNLITLVFMLFHWPKLQDKATQFIQLSVQQRYQRLVIGLAIVLLLVPALHTLLRHEHLSDVIVVTAGILMVGIILFLAFQEEGIARQRFIVFLVLVLLSAIFWVIYQLSPMGLTLFAQYNVNRQILGFTIAPGWIQNINSVTIILGGPLLAYIFRTLQKSHRDFSISSKFSIGLVLGALGLLVLPLGIYWANPNTGYVAFIWIFICYVFEALAELFISPIGYSMVGRLVPQKYQSQMMGVVLLNSGVAAVLASFFSNYALGKSDSNNPMTTNPHYAHAFWQLGLATAAVALVLIVLIPKFRQIEKSKIESVKQ